MRIDRRPGGPGRARPGNSEPHLRVLPSAGGRTRAVVLVLHGGKARSTEPARTQQPAYRRMLPFARVAHRETAACGGAVWLLRNRLRGWNEPYQHPMDDARWALAEIDRRHPSARVVLVGHSMGGRVALRLAGEPQVSAVCALAPWIERDEPVRQLDSKPVLIAHGDRDRITSPRASAEYARLARRFNPHVRLVEITGSGHAMLRRSSEWNALVRRFVSDAVRTGGHGPEEGDR